MYLRGILWLFGLFLWTAEMVESSPKAPTNPGIKVLVSQRGLSYAAKSVVSSLNGKRLPDIHKKAKGVKCDMYGMKIDSFTFSDSKLTPNSGQNMEYILNNAKVSISGRMKCKKILKKKYGFKVQLSGLSLDVKVKPGISTSGRPTSVFQSCTSKLLGTSCSVSGGAFSKKVKKMMTKKLNEFRRPNALCPSVRDFISVKIGQYLSRIPVLIPLNGTNLAVDSRLMSAPIIGSGYIETHQKGEIFYGKNRSEAPFSPKSISVPKSSTKMVTVCLSDYVTDTLGFVLHKNGLLKYNINKQNVPAQFRGYLNTTCGGGKQCIGKIVKQLGDKFPNSSVEILVQTASTPVAYTSRDQVTGRLKADVKFNVRQPSNKVSLGFAIKMDLNVSSMAQIKQNQGFRITANVKNVTFLIKVSKSNIGPISDSYLKTVFGLALKTAIMPEIKKIGAKGFPIPSVVGPLQFVDPKLSLLQDTICFEADVQYKPKY